jgi:hypothetical protein
MEHQSIVVAVFGEQPEVLDRPRRVGEEGNLDRSFVVACVPPLLFAPAGTFGLPREGESEPHAATVTAIRHQQNGRVHERIIVIMRVQEC